jgi:hypothetical protein
LSSVFDLTIAVIFKARNGLSLVLDILGLV